jgi:hypothetical protein
MSCKTASEAITISAASSVSESGIISSESSPLVIVLLLHGENASQTAPVCSALLDSLSRVGPAVLPPRNSKTVPRATIRCIPSAPPVCVVYAHLETAAAAAAIVLPDLVVQLPCCSPASPSQEPVALQLQSALPALPVVCPSSTHSEAVQLFRALAPDGAVDWQQFAAASIACARSLRCVRPVRPIPCSRWSHFRAQFSAPHPPRSFSACVVGRRGCCCRRRCCSICLDSIARCPRRRDASHCRS